MNVKKLSLFFVIFMLVIPLFLEAETELSGRDIMVKVDNRPDGENSRTLMHMVLINKRGQARERTVRFYSMDVGEDSKNLIFFQSPADIKGVGFLSWEYEDPGRDDDRWLYLPAMKKVKRISGSSKNDYFMGTDFTYDDMGDRSVDEDIHTLLREETVDGNVCWVVESTPQKTQGEMYSKTVNWIRKDALIPIKTEYYDRMGELLKILTVPEIGKKDGFWTAFRMEMNNIQEKHQTILEMKEVEYNVDINESLFKVSTLQRGRVQ